MAGGAPVRRYNATSARSLAVYLASQDNPEQALCPHPKLENDIPRRVTVTKASTASVIDVKPSDHAQNMNESNNQGTRTTKITSTNRNEGDESLDREPSLSRRVSRHRKDITPPSEKNSMASGLDEPAKTDHKSFVQAVFGTAAFKMVEWLAPRHLQRLSHVDHSSISHDAGVHEDETATLKTVERKPSEQPVSTNVFDPMDKKSSPEIPTTTSAQQHQENVPLKRKSRPTITKPTPSFSASHDDKPVLRRKNSHVRTSSENLEHPTRGILNYPLKNADTDGHHFSPLKSPSRSDLRFRPN